MRTSSIIFVFVSVSRLAWAESKPANGKTTKNMALHVFVIEPSELGPVLPIRKNQVFVL
jgi:hypothetical protein